MNAFYSFIDRVVDEQAEMAANDLSVDQIKDVDIRDSSRKVIKPQHLAIIKKNATRAIEDFIEAAKRKEIAEAAQAQLTSSIDIRRQDSHQSGNYACLTIDIENDSDEIILEKGLSVVAKDWQGIIALGDSAEELRRKIETLECLDRLDVKGCLAHVNGAMSMYITETRKVRVLEWVQWRREELEAAETATTDEEVEIASEEGAFASLKGVDIEMIVESNDEDEETNIDQDVGVAHTDAIKKDVVDTAEDMSSAYSDDQNNATLEFDNSAAQEVEEETGDKAASTGVDDWSKSSRSSSLSPSQIAGHEPEAHESMLEDLTSVAEVEEVGDQVSENGKVDSVLEDSTKVKPLSRSQKRKRKAAAKKAQEEAELAATPWTEATDLKIQFPLPASKKTVEKKKVNAKAATRRAIETIFGPENVAIAFELNESGSQVTIDIVLSNPEDIDLLASSSDSSIPATTSLNIYYPNHDVQYSNHPYAVTSCDISSVTVSELLEIASTLMKARGYLTAKRDNYVWTEAVKRKFHSKAMSAVLTMPVINRARLNEVPEMEASGSVPATDGSGGAEESDGGEVEDDDTGEEDRSAEDGEADENSDAKDGVDEEDDGGNEGGNFSILDLLRGLHHTWDDMGTFGWLALGFLVWFFLAYIGGYQGGELSGKH